jgi:hypothetical protein
MDDGTDGWMEKASRPRRPLLYVIPLKEGIGGERRPKEKVKTGLLSR